MKAKSVWSAVLITVLCSALTLRPMPAGMAFTAPCPPFDEFLQRVNVAEGRAAKQALVNQFVDCLQDKNTPIIEAGSSQGFGRAVFLYQGPAARAAVAGDMNGWSPNTQPMTHVAETDLFYFVREFELDARLDYKFVINGSTWILDPLNERTMPGGFGPNSQFWMPDYVPPPEVEFYPSIPHGQIETFSLTSNILRNTRAISIYLPPDYRQSSDRYPVLYVHDGADYLNFAKINNIVDYLINQKTIPPIIVVMVPPVQRTVEYNMNPSFVEFFVNEVVATVDERYRTKPSPAFRGLIGDSLGGLAAVYMALVRPEVFGKSAGQSGAYFDRFLQLVGASDKKDVVFHLDVGTYESSVSGLNLLEANRRLRQIMMQKGYSVQYIEVHEGHSWGSWRARIDDALKLFWGVSGQQSK